MTAFRLAYRNLRRTKRRTILTASALMIGLTVLIFSMGMLDGIDKQSIDNLIFYDLAHLKGFTPGWIDQDFPDLDLAIGNSDSLLNVVRNLEGVDAAVQRLELTGMLIFGREEMFVIIMGIDPIEDKEVFKMGETVTQGAALSPDKPFLLIGARLARDIGLKVGDNVTLLVRSAPGAFNPRTLPITGIISTGHPKVDQLNAYIPLKLAREMALLPDHATEIAVLAKRFSKVNRLADELTGIVPSLEWLTLNDLADDFLQLAKVKRIGSGIMIMIITLVAAVGLGNTMIMSVHERTREIGALRALGFSRQLIGSIFLWEGFIIGAAAGITAVFLGTAITLYFGIKGISLAHYEGMDIGYPVQDAVYPAIYFTNILMSFVFGLVISLVASWGSARRAARGEVVRALREGML